jgi:hypothetical protein
VLFDVRVIAFDPHAAVDPVEALIRLFKIDRTFAREVVHRLPRVIKRGVTLEMAQRLGQVLERIGAQVEILVSERGADAADSAQRASGSLVLARAILGKGLPPPSPEALVHEPANTQTAPSLVPRTRVYGESRPALASLPEPSQQEDGSAPLRQLANVRASLPQPDQRRTASTPRVEAREPGLEARGRAREAFPEAPATGGRALARNSLPGQEPAPGRLSQPGNGSAPGRHSLPGNGPAPGRHSLPGNGPGPGRLSLPMGSWSDVEQEESRVTRASLPDANAAPFQDPERPSTAQQGLGKPSVKEILARRSLSQTSPGVERITRGETNAAAPGARAEPLALPTFAAKGPSIADDIDELPETLSLRRKLSFLTVLIFLGAGVFSAGLLPLAVWISRSVQKRRRARALRERQASSLLVNHAQLAELYHCVKHLAIRMELSPSPRVYVVERLPTKVQSFTQNGGLVIALDAQLLSVCARRDAGYVVQFLLAHEMAAHVLGQHRGGRQLLMALWANLRKHELFSADALAVKLMPDRNDAVRALSAQLCGPELAHLIDLNELDRQASNQEQEAAKAQTSGEEDPSYLLPRILFLRRK